PEQEVGVLKPSRLARMHLRVAGSRWSFGPPQAWIAPRRSRTFGDPGRKFRPAYCGLPFTAHFGVYSASIYDSDTAKEAAHGSLEAESDFCVRQSLRPDC